MPVSDFKWLEDIPKFDESFIKSYNEESDEGYFLQADIQYLEKLHDLLNDLPFSPKRIKTEKFEKRIVNLQDKTEYVIQI